MVTQLTDKTYTKFINSSKLVLLDFWSDWCIPCKSLAPILEKISLSYADKISFGKISVKDYPNVASKFQVVGIPCLIIFNNGKEIDRIIGAYSAGALKAKIDKMVKEI